MSEHVKLSDLQKSRDVPVEGTDIVVTIRELTWPDFMQSLEIKDMMERGVFRLTHVIEKWNVVDDENKVLPVNDENIRKLPANVVLPLIEAVKKSSDPEKKKSH